MSERITLQCLHGKNVLLFYMQLALSWVAFGILCWNGVMYYKKWMAREAVSEMYMWTSIFSHPVESSGLNYVVVCILLAIIALLVYVLKQRMTQFLKRELASVNPILLVASASLSIAILLHIFLQPSPRIKVLESAFLILLPFVIIASLELFRNILPQRKRLLFILAFGLFVLVCIEPLAFMVGPVRMMNEYPDIFGETNIKGKNINNKLFLTNFDSQDACAVNVFFKMKEKLDGLRLNIPEEYYLHYFLTKYKYTNIDSMQQKYMGLLNETDYTKGLLRSGAFLDEIAVSSEESCIRQIQNVDIEGIKQFYNANLLEYYHQNIGRGQINHIGHILNPLNEYALGKSPENIYMQYGLGNTFIMKWIMDLFGGLSIKSYYKIYVLYIIYYLSFLLMILYLFKDDTYVLGTYSIIPVCFFFQGYIAFTLAPGIIPSIHLLDTSAIIFLIAFFRRNNHAYLAVAIFLVLVSALINRQFGAALMAALLASLGLYAFENTEGKKRYFWLTLLACFVVLAVAVLRFSTLGKTSQVFPNFLEGLFSWPANPQVIFLTVIYLVISYGYLIFLKNQRFYLKYVYIFVFIYAHIFLLYFYWSGLLNHLIPVIPFCWLQLFIMLYIARKELFPDRTVAGKVVNLLVITLTILSVLCILPAGAIFYKEKRQFHDNFKNHRTYEWQMDRAQVITTIDQKIMEKAILLVQTYSDKENPGICILSKYDGLIPFLANRYSIMPFSELNSYLFSRKEYEAALETVREQTPRYLFVDNNLRDHGPEPWANLYTASLFSAERISRMGRYALLYKIFLQIEADYKKIDQTELISVYERKS